MMKHHLEFAHATLTTLVQIHNLASKDMSDVYDTLQVYRLYLTI